MAVAGGCADFPDLKELESKVGQKPPDGLLRWLREDPAAQLSPSSPGRGLRQGLGEKIKALKLELAYLRAIDVKILQQLVAVNEGIEAVKWLLEEKGMLTSRCSSLTSSQYSLIESQETSRRGSWNSLQDPNDKLDSISIGSYLDTLADDMDDYGQGSGIEPMMTSTPGRPMTRVEKTDPDQVIPTKMLISEQDKSEEDHEKVHSLVKNQGVNEQNKAARQPQAVTNGVLGGQNLELEQGTAVKFTSAVENTLTKGNPASRAFRNKTVGLENCKLNSRLYQEYDAHWQWVQSQDDVTFL